MNVRENELHEAIVDEKKVIITRFFCAKCGALLAEDMSPETVTKENRVIACRMKMQNYCHVCGAKCRC